MTQYQFVALTLSVIGPLLALALALQLPPSLVMFATGLLAAVLPGLPELHVDPNLVLTLFLPPLLYASTVRVSWHLLRLTLLPGVVLGCALVGATIGLVATAARLMMPMLGWTSALLLGSVTAVFDTRLFHEAKGRPHVPRAISDTLKARELVGRVFILATFSLALDAVEPGRLSIWLVVEHFLLDIPLGALLGSAIGYATVRVRERIDPAPVEIAVSIAMPYAAALAATGLGLSIVATITAAALVVNAVRIDRETGAPISSSETRVSAVAFWEQASLMISAAVFFLAGLAMPEALQALTSWPGWHAALTAGGLLAIVLTVQFTFSFAAAGLDPVAGALEAREPRGRARGAAAAIMAWASTRSVIGLLLALSIPVAADIERGLILVLAALVILGSILLQGLTLRKVLEVAGFHEGQEDAREEETARRVMQAAAQAPGREHASGHNAARQALLSLREADRVGDEVLSSVLKEVDLSERVAEGDALPGAGPPNP